jgi:hypothetical protein
MANTLAYGFVGLDHLMAERLSDSNVEVVRDAIGLSVAEHNRQVQTLVSELAVPTTDYKSRFLQVGSGTLQPLDDYGNPLPVREAGYYDVAFPIHGGGTAWGDNRVSRALMTVEEVNMMTLSALRRDADWMKRHIMASIFDNVAWTYSDPLYGSLTIEGLANGGTETFGRRNGDASIDDNYLAQAASIADANNPFGTIHTELTEHPENAGSPIVAYVPSNVVTDIEALTAFSQVGDPDIALGNASDSLRGSIDRGFGDELLGKTNKVWIVEWSALPDDYIVAVARNSAKPVLKMRQHPAAQLQGLFTEEANPDGNLSEHRFIRYAGFGAYNRVGAVAMRIGNASYAIPSGYDAPLAV